MRTVLIPLKLNVIELGGSLWPLAQELQAGCDETIKCFCLDALRIDAVLLC